MEERTKGRACKQSHKCENKGRVCPDGVTCFGFIVHLSDEARGATVGECFQVLLL